MSRTRRGDGEAFDNIAVGSVISSQERTVAGAVPPVELGIWKDNLISGSAQGSGVRSDNYIAGTATPVLENVKAGG